MAGAPSGWYADPTTRHIYRYWTGVAWTDQVTDGGRAGIDPIAVEPQWATTPPGPGTQAPGQAEPPPAMRQAPRKSSKWLTFVLVLVAILIVAVIAVALASNDSDSGDSDGGDPDPPTTAETAPPTTETTETPDTTEAPGASTDE